MMQKRVNSFSKTNYGDYRVSWFFLVLFLLVVFISSFIGLEFASSLINIYFLMDFFYLCWWTTLRHSFLQKIWRYIDFLNRELSCFIICTQFFINTWNFRSKSLCLKTCLNKTTKAFMCLKSVLFPVLTLPNPAVKAFYVLIFSKSLCAYFWTAKALCA